MTLLKLDFDGPIPRGFFFRLRHCVKLWNWTVAGVRYDRTRRGWHVTVAIEEVVIEPIVVAAQAILGSDPAREAFNLGRCQFLKMKSKFWRARWNVLYERHSRGVQIAS